VQVRKITQDDFHWLHQFDCSPLNIERDSIYLFFCVHFSQTSFVALNDKGSPVGFLLGFLSAGSTSAYIHYLFVEKAKQRCGIGRQMMQAFEENVRELGAQRITLYTRSAVEFYRGMGYALENPIFSPTVEDYVRKVKQVHVMSRVL